MAIGSIKKEVSDLFSTTGEAYNKAVEVVGDKMVHIITVNVSQASTAMIKATVHAIYKKYENNRNIANSVIKKAKPGAFTESTWKTLVNDVLNEWNTPASTSIPSMSGPVDGTYKVKDSSKTLPEFIITPGTVINKTGAFSNVNYQIFYKYIAKKTFTLWLKKYGELSGDIEIGTGGYPDQSNDIGMRTTHVDASVYEAFLTLKADEIQGQFSSDLITFDIAQELINALRIDLKEDTRLDMKKYDQKRVVKLTLNDRDIKLPYDNFDGKVKKKFLDACEKILKDNLSYLSEEKAAALKASKPFKKQVEEAARRDVIRTIVKDAKKKKNIKKVSVRGAIPKAKAKPRKTALKKPRSGKKPTTKKLTIAQKVSVAKAEQAKRKKGEKGTDSNADLLKIQRDINRRLGAEVRRNMGRPALMNRTGVFSNSVELVKLFEAQNSVVAKYTYQLFPYATFENTGQRKWPLAYNPKPLIAKSIRNLAQGRIEQKLTVRRM